MRAAGMEEGFQGGLLRILYFLQERVVEKEARPKEALPTALFPAMSLVRGWEEGNDSIPVLRELPAVGGG